MKINDSTMSFAFLLLFMRAFFSIWQLKLPTYIHTQAAFNAYDFIRLNSFSISPLKRKYTLRIEFHEALNRLALNRLDVNQSNILVVITTY